MTSIDERTGLVKLYNSKQEREVVEQYAGRLLHNGAVQVW
jgi:hypothetical protein